MTLPTFIGIGAPRCGTTWLYELLKSHPQVFMPPDRKQIDYFTRFYDRGEKWYASFFDSSAGRTYREYGEFTPDYFYDARCPDRIRRVASIQKLVLCLRNPCDRLLSSYNNQVTMKGYSRSFERYIQDRPDHVAQGFYARYLRGFLEYFTIDRFLILIFENTVGAPETAKAVLAGFLAIDPERFPAEAGTGKVNASFRPRARKLYGALALLTAFLRNTCGLDRFVDRYTAVARKTPFYRAFRQDRRPPVSGMPEKTRRMLAALYEEEIDQLEKMAGIDLLCWKEAGSRPEATAAFGPSTRPRRP